MIQGGDPKGDGTGGPGYSVVEAPPKDLVYAKGVVAMAKTGAEPAGTSGSQFFVVTAEDAQLPPDYALLGKVTGGQDVVDKIGVAETDPATEAPVEPVVIASVKVSRQRLTRSAFFSVVADAVGERDRHARGDLRARGLEPLRGLQR